MIRKTWDFSSEIISRRLSLSRIFRTTNSPRGSGQSISEALAEVNAGTAAGETYVTVVNYYLEAGDIETAYLPEEDSRRRDIFFPFPPLYFDSIRSGLS